MDPSDHHRYPKWDENGKWCVNLGGDKGLKRFDSLEEAAKALETRIREIDQRLKREPPRDR
jgi:hypothetical protein